jgi:hypothetical protein
MLHTHLNVFGLIHEGLCIIPRRIIPVVTPGADGGHGLGDGARLSQQGRPKGAVVKGRGICQLNQRQHLHETGDSTKWQPTKVARPEK